MYLEAVPQSSLQKSHFVQFLAIYRTILYTVRLSLEISWNEHSSYIYFSYLFSGFMYVSCLCRPSEAGPGGATLLFHFTYFFFISLHFIYIHPGTNRDCKGWLGSGWMRTPGPLALQPDVLPLNHLSPLIIIYPTIFCALRNCSREHSHKNTLYTLFRGSHQIPAYGQGVSLTTTCGDRKIPTPDVMELHGSA
jgi:hypothetical protein